MALSDDQIEEEGICKICRGNGSYGIQVEKDGQVELEYKFCEVCDGTGFDKSNGDFD